MESEGGVGEVGSKDVVGGVEGVRADDDSSFSPPSRHSASAERFLTRRSPFSRGETTFLALAGRGVLPQETKEAGEGVKEGRRVEEKAFLRRQSPLSGADTPLRRRRPCSETLRKVLKVLERHRGRRRHRRHLRLYEKWQPLSQATSVIASPRQPA